MKKVSVLELFAGAGGLALGFESAGLETVGLVECDKDSVATLRHNRPKWNVIHERVEHVDWQQFCGVDVVSGGFPCQAFSYAGKGLGFADSRGGLVFEMFRCIDALNPKVIVAENVPGLASHRGGETLRTIVSCLSDRNYEVFTEIIVATDYGVPQKRKRLLITGVRRDLNFLIPGFTRPTTKGKPVTLRQALKNCPSSPGAKYPEYKQKVLSMVPEGGCWVDLPDSVQREYMGSAYGHNGAMGGRRGMARRLSWDQPSLTILCSPAQKQTERCHPKETRPLTVRESARIQTFPDSWEFMGSLSSQYRQVGNAVPVKMGEAVGKFVMSILSDEQANVA